MPRSTKGWKLCWKSKEKQTDSIWHCFIALGNLDVFDLNTCLRTQIVYSAFCWKVFATFKVGNVVMTLGPRGPPMFLLWLLFVRKWRGPSPAIFMSLNINLKGTASEIRKSQEILTKIKPLAVNFDDWMKSKKTCEQTIEHSETST